jgi:hypothetical protein
MNFLTPGGGFVLRDIGKIVGNWTYGDCNAHLGICMVDEGLGKWLLNESYEN